MAYSRREFGKLALATVPAAALYETPLFGTGLFQAARPRPMSKINGVQIGVITYSYRQMPDQSAEATLGYVIDSNISAIELMDGPAEMFAGKPAQPPRQGGPGAAGAGRGAGGARAAGGGLPGGGRANTPSCIPGQGPVAREGGAGGGRQGGGRGPAPELTPEQQEAQRAAQAAAAAYQADVRKWRETVGMEKFAALRKMYNDAGVTIYAYKSDGMPKNMNTTDAELDYLFKVTKTLGATHTTMELPGANETGRALMKRMSEFAEKHQIPVAYHTHGQGSMTAFDEAIAMSKWNKINVDLGHYVAAGNVGGGPIQFLEKHHANIVSFHLKDRMLPINCGTTVPYGTGDGQIKEILLAMKANKWTFPATVELEYAIPAGSDAAKETAKCVEYAKACLA
jgi:sugar phosphate isomerase/epimerase